MTLGLIAAFLSAGCYELGYVLQALEARSQPATHALRASLMARLALRRRWVAGTALSAAGAALQVLALAHAPVTLVQPVLALGLVGLLLFARSALREHVGVLELLGASGVIAGVVTVGVEGPPLSRHIHSVTALVLLLVPLAALLFAPFGLREQARLRLASFGAAAGDALAAVGLKLTADAAALGHWGFAVLAVACAAAAGTLALTAEMSALRTLPATQVAPVVLAAQVVVPAIAGVAAFGEPITAPVVAGVLCAGGGAALLGASGAIAGLLPGVSEAKVIDHDPGGAGQGGERVVR